VQGANVSSALLFVLILLLLLGTEVLSWYWMVLVPAVSAGAGLYLARRRTPGLYAAAQMVDARMGLADTLSTAVHFSRTPPGADETASGVRRKQGEQAERLAATVDVRRAVPYTMPRTVWLVVGLAVTALTLFALRYGLDRKLDLRPPLANMLRQQLGWNRKPDLARNDGPRSSAKPGDPGENPEAGEDAERNGAAQPDPARGNEPGATDPGSAAADNPKPIDSANASGEDGEARAEKSDDPPGDERTGASPQDGKGQSQSSGKRDANNSGDNSSWMSKLKDAFQNLLSRADPRQGSQGRESGSPDKQAGKGQPSAAKREPGQEGQPSADRHGDAQDGQPGEEGKSAGKNEGRKNSAQPGSGAGSQDGDKSIKQAQQLEAMGKLSELYGKRAATITGEATVEVQSTHQQLRTQYVQRGAQHSQSGAEIERDAVPMALQSYVERYFEQVRKP
jgi:hypothetical protein